MSKQVHIYFSFRRKLAILLGKPLILEFGHDVRSFVGRDRLYIFDDEVTGEKEQ